MYVDMKIVVICLLAVAPLESKVSSSRAYISIPESIVQYIKTSKDYIPDSKVLVKRRTWLPKGREALEDTFIGSVLRNAPSGARFLGVRDQNLTPILDRLPDNSTLIRENIVDTFSCKDRVYGYYADQDNDCQVFHVCVPFHQIYPDNFTSPITYQFSFICPEYTAFTQDAMVCAWAKEAVPCSVAHELYSLNENFFKIPKKEEEFKQPEESTNTFFRSKKV